MSKIWEVDFTSFSGTNAYDNMGTQNLTSPYNITKVTPLPGFNYRGGVNFYKNASVANYYDLWGSVTKATFKDTYTRRSFVFWFYNPGAFSNTTFWDSTPVCVWGAWNSVTTGANPNYGFAVNNTTASSFKLMNDNTVLIDFGTFTGWHMIVVTIDRSAVSLKGYLDGVLKTNTNTNMPAYGQSGFGDSIGNRFASTCQGNYYVGYMATYDHILSQAEVSLLYSAPPVDTSAISPPFQSCSGYIYSAQQIGVSGVTLDLFSHDINAIVYTTTSSGDGSYTLSIPYPGYYSVLAYNLGNSSSYMRFYANANGVSFL